MGNQSSHHPPSGGSSTSSVSNFGTRSGAIMNRRSSNNGATSTTTTTTTNNTTNTPITSLSPTPTLTTASTASSSSSPSLSRNGTRPLQPQPPSSSSSSGTNGIHAAPAAGAGGLTQHLNLRNVFQQLHMKHGGHHHHHNALGITKQELDERCQPSGLYSTCYWEDKTIRRLIGDGKLASRQQWDAEKYGMELDADHHECPICFFTYPQMNTTKCCQANICTECYLQLQPYQKPDSQGNYSKPITMNAKTQQNACPFCNSSKLAVTVGTMKQIQSQQQQPQPEQPMSPLPYSKDVTHDQPESNPNTTYCPTTTTPTSGFGSSLEQNDRVAMMRARSCSIASEHSHSSSTTTSVKDQQEMVSQAAMTVLERRQIEEEMRAQHLHPLALKIEQEEMERRLKNQLQYYSQQQQHRNEQPRPSSSSGQQFIPRRVYPTPPHHPQHPQQQQQQRRAPAMPPNLSNILFLQHPSRAVGMPPPPSTSSSLAVRGLSEEQQIALAIEASLRDSAANTN